MPGSTFQTNPFDLDKLLRTAITAACSCRIFSVVGCGTRTASRASSLQSRGPFPLAR